MLPGLYDNGNTEFKDKKKWVFNHWENHHELSNKYNLMINVSNYCKVQIFLIL